MTINGRITAVIEGGKKMVMASFPLLAESMPLPHTARLESAYMRRTRKQIIFVANETNLIEII